MGASASSLHHAASEGDAEAIASGDEADQREKFEELVDLFAKRR